MMLSKNKLKTRGLAVQPNITTVLVGMGLDRELPTLIHYSVMQYIARITSQRLLGLYNSWESTAHNFSCGILPYVFSLSMNTITCVAIIIVTNSSK